ncbi:ABC transporter ATP-binding protein [Johnsonella ignava]|uniref:ABC transporter ATP-binding protein n=1 Tax=Johnsonella ignava TaxID=43995 RepID=UPI0023F128D4|nr:ABC transporter ATP-binding protein [Johnsonella ignava]
MDRKFEIKTVKRLLRLIIKKNELKLFVVGVCILFSSLSMVMGISFLKPLVDNYIEPLIGVQNPDYLPMLGEIIRMGIIFTFGIICSYAHNYIMVYVGQGIMKDVRRELFEHMESLPIAYFDTHSHGDIMSVYTNDTDTLRQFVSQALPQVLSAVITIVSVFVSMCLINVPLALTTVLMVVVMLNVSGKTLAFSGKYFISQQEKLGQVNGYIEEMISGQKVIKVFCHEDEALKNFSVLNEQLRVNAQKANSFANILMPIVTQLGNLSYVIVAILGAVFIINGYFGLTVGSLVAFLSLVRSFNSPFSQIGGQVNIVISAFAGAGRVFKLLDEKSETDEGYVVLVNAYEDKDGNLRECEKRSGTWAWKHYHKADESTTYKKLEGDIVLEGVDFSYIKGKTVLHDISLYAHKGQKVAFVGSTGAGKTTVTNLLNRFYDIDSGKIRYDGINIQKIKKSELRKSLGIVLQDTHLFTGSVMDNIRYARPDASDDECIHAAKIVNAHSFIKRLPRGYDTVLSGDGTSLSQGQRQLLSIARAALADPPVLILDEATSSIDTHTERLVQDGMDALMDGRTTFVIAHRLSTIRNADCIMVLEAGRIIERGSHEELIKHKGRYFQLYTGLAVND